MTCCLLKSYERYMQRYEKYSASLPDSDKKNECMNTYLVLISSQYVRDAQAYFSGSINLINECDNAAELNWRDFSGGYDYWTMESL